MRKARGVFITRSIATSRPDLAVTQVENHDTQPLQSLEQTVEGKISECLRGAVNNLRRQHFDL